MATEVKVPALGESVSEATVARWFKEPGDAVLVDEPLAELETDKVTVEVPCPLSGVLEQRLVQEGETVAVGSVLAVVKAGDAPAQKAPKSQEKTPEETAKNPPPAKKEERPALSLVAGTGNTKASSFPPSPAVRRLAEETGRDPGTVLGTGKDGRVTKGDMLSAPEAPVPSPASSAAPSPSAPRSQGAGEERVRMSRLRMTIAKRLKEAQNTAAMLTTFNELDMTAVMALRGQYKDAFEKRHGVKLGFMGFFVKAVVQALGEIPSVNAEIDGDDVVYKDYCHIGVAVGTEKGLVVPVVRNAQDLSLADIEKTIGGFGKKAREGALKIEDMQGGTFTISNGGIYGSLMSTPILNAPQSGILGMHKIQERPVVIAGKIEIRPMMYLALSYDHRLVDGKEAVTFLVRVKECLEDPQRLILDV